MVHDAGPGGVGATSLVLQITFRRGVISTFHVEDCWPVIELLPQSSMMDDVLGWLTAQMDGQRPEG